MLFLVLVIFFCLIKGLQTICLPSPLMPCPKVPACIQGLASRPTRPSIRLLFRHLHLYPSPSLFILLFSSSTLLLPSTYITLFCWHPPFFLPLFLRTPFCLSLHLSPHLFLCTLCLLNKSILQSLVLSLASFLSLSLFVLCIYPPLLTLPSGPLLHPFHLILNSNFGSCAPFSFSLLVCILCQCSSPLLLLLSTSFFNLSCIASSISSRYSFLSPPKPGSPNTFAPRPPSLFCFLSPTPPLSHLLPRPFKPLVHYAYS